MTKATIVLLVLACALACAAAPSNATAAANTAAKAAPEAPEPPKSVFVMPTNFPKDGRDPFFPNRVLINAVAQTTPTNRPVVQTVALVLNGISGTAVKRLCMINGHTFGKGDDDEIKTSDGRKVRVRCLEINEDSATVEVEGQRRELRLRPQ
jgi:hypothetical protein